ncbi:MAG: VWA domain-containing protein [Pyrinomonadaceae bacterium]|nr:VWA domain-containing protein [Pyrinomonadaceae bacterium]
MAELENENLVLFCRALREHGLIVTPAEVVVAVTTLRLIDACDRTEVFLSLRTVLTSRVEDFPVFEALFETFWNRLPEKLVQREATSNTNSHAQPLSQKRPTRGLAFFLKNWTTSRGADTEALNVPEASDIESVAEKDFTAFGNDELEEIARLARRVVKRLARNPSRRWKPVRNGRRVNLRRSFRQSLKTGGELIELSYKQRKPKRTKLVVICDVSGSMDVYSRLLLQFVYGLQNSFAKVETFVFSTSLSRITGYLKNKTYQRALERLSSKVRGWSGGTRIGASLATFNAEWLRQVDKRTIVIILSDGWDTGEPEQLAQALAQLKKRAGRLIWLNPLLGSSTYQPMTRGMQAALPFINVFAPAHDLASLRALEQHLVL